MSDQSVFLFDIGGVFVKLGGMRKVMAWTGLTPDEIKTRWAGSETVRQFESGRAPWSQFAKAIVSEWRLPLDPEELKAEFASWAGELFPRAKETLHEIQRSHTTACLTNTNPIQWPLVRDQLGLGKLLDHHFVSYETGLMKPDLEAFVHVSERLEVDPQDIIFLDDSRENVDAATRAGLKGHLVEGVEGVRSTLAGLGSEFNWPWA